MSGTPRTLTGDPLSDTVEDVVAAVGIGAGDKCNERSEVRARSGESTEKRLCLLAYEDLLVLLVHGGFRAMSGAPGHSSERYGGHLAAATVNLS